VWELDLPRRCASFLKIIGFPNLRFGIDRTLKHLITFKVFQAIDGFVKDVLHLADRVA
jgi:hypothetical protein